MNKNYKFIGMLIILYVPFTIMAQYASNYKLTNFQQQNESYFEFDLELHNTGSIAFGMEAAACRIDFNQYISGYKNYIWKQLTKIILELNGDHKKSDFGIHF